MNRRPTLAELRCCVQKGEHRRIGNWLARHWARPTAVYGTWGAVRLGLGAHQVTGMALMAGLSAAAAIGTGTRGGFVAGAVLNLLAFWLDRVDGQVARWRGTAGLEGVYLDYVMHYVHNLALGFALGYGLASRTGDVSWSLAGLGIATGWTVLALHNDCRYKAIVQRLKRETTAYRVEGGAGGRPEPPAPWPRRGVGIVTWPALKACEPHAVALGLLAMAVLALAVPAWWVAGWRGSALLMGVGAPLLAAGRLVRAVRGGAASSEFDRWFRPISTPLPAAGPAASNRRVIAELGGLPHATEVDGPGPGLAPAADRGPRGR